MAITIILTEDQATKIRKRLQWAASDANLADQSENEAVALEFGSDESRFKKDQAALYRGIALGHALQALGILAEGLAEGQVPA